MSNPPNVLLLHNVASPERLPLFEALSKEVNLHVVFCNMSTDYRENKEELLDEYSFEYTYLQSIEIDLGDKHPLVFCYDLINKLLTIDFDVIIACENPPIAPNILTLSIISFLTRTPFIVWTGVIERHYDETWQQNPIKKWLVNGYRKILYLIADAFVAYGKKAKDYLVNRGIDPSNISHGTQVIDIDGESSVEVQDDLDHSSIILPETNHHILYLGYLIPRKGIEYLIEAYQSLDRPDTSLIIAGKGESRSKLESMSSNREDIVFTGFVSGEDKKKVYKSASVFVLPTLFDPWGLVINEAMEFGLPIITTDRAGAAEELVKDNGFVVPARDPEAIIDSIQKLLNDDELRKNMGRNSTEIIKTFDLDYGVKTFMNSIELIGDEYKWD